MMHLSIDHNSSVPLHIQAEELLRKMIEDPLFRSGKFLPNEVELSKQLQISRTTLRQALNKLVYEGLLVRKKGIGTKVSEKTVSSKSMNWKSFSQEMAARGIPIRNFELHISWVKPHEELIHFFDIKPEQKILKLERLRGQPEGPFVYFVSYFHPNIGLNGEEDFKRPLYEILEKDYHVIASLSKEEISARAADSFIAGKLEIDAGSPVLFRKRFVYNQEDHPIELNLGYYKSDSFIYTVESRR
ncbi:GntR family transcriptional regulator [Chitinophaga rhizophila]|uniref:GntR family transcriptional regulator n=1 Tax=Chitinophaga rhizophila TaxID=2866212 RepID=A0ABS7G8H8_9BACT|nr:GntR family transcriptional regulator [Chitinophaga rhizophila]MBW8683610.1 GntR family transcriptional regulator [Chitinophaga rhizophila]